MNVTIHCYLLVPLLSCVINYNYVLYSLGGGRGTPPGLGRTSSLGRVGTPTDGQCLVPHPQTEGEWPTPIKARGSPS